MNNDINKCVIKALESFELRDKYYEDGDYVATQEVESDQREWLYELAEYVKDGCKNHNTYVSGFNVEFKQNEDNAEETIETIQYLIDRSMHTMFMCGKCNINYYIVLRLKDVLDYMFKNCRLVYLNVSITCRGTYKIYYYDSNE